MTSFSFLSPDAASATPLLPEQGAAGTPLTIVIAVLAFMASIALSGYFMVSRAVEDWTGNLAGTVTVQVKGSTPDIIGTNASRVLDLLSQTDGFEGVKQLERSDSEKLLEPWLGTDNLGLNIPIPALITADVTPERRQNLEPIRAQLFEISAGASLDDHGLWNDRLVSAARRGQSVAFIIFIMVMGASAAVIIFATRAGLAANKRVVEVMHLVGATDQFIADQVQRRYLSLGLRGGSIGAVVAALVLFISASFETDGQGFFLPNLGANPMMLVWLLLVPALLCGVASLTARLTVLRALKEQM